MYANRKRRPKYTHVKVGPSEGHGCNNDIVEDDDSDERPHVVEGCIGERLGVDTVALENLRAE